MPVTVQERKIRNNKEAMSNTKIPGLSFSWKRALGVTKVKREFTKATGIPTTKAGVERKLGSAIISTIGNLFK